MEFVFTRIAEKQFLALERNTQERIKKKLQSVKEQQSSVDFEPLYDLLPATHRIRIGDYRLMLLYEKESDRCTILKVGHRRDIYR